MIAVTLRLLVIQNAVNLIAPLRIGQYAVYVALRRFAVADQEYILLVKAEAAHAAQKAAYHIALYGHPNHAGQVEHNDQSPREMIEHHIFGAEIQHQREEQKAYRIDL